MRPNHFKVIKSRRGKIVFDDNTVASVVCNFVRIETFCPLIFATFQIAPWKNARLISLFSVAVVFFSDPSFCPHFAFG